MTRSPNAAMQGQWESPVAGEAYKKEAVAGEAYKKEAANNDP